MTMMQLLDFASFFYSETETRSQLSVSESNERLVIVTEAVHLFAQEALRISSKYLDTRKALSCSEQELARVEAELCATQAERDKLRSSVTDSFFAEIRARNDEIRKREVRQGIQQILAQQRRERETFSLFSDGF